MSVSEDPLVFLPVEKWSELKSVFKSDWPRSICGLLLLETQESLLKSMASWVDYSFKVYCPYGNVNNGMVALNIKDTFHDVIIQCPNDNTKELEKALTNTRIIDWKKCDSIPALPEHVMDCVNRAYHKILSIDAKEYSTKAFTFVLDKEAPMFDVSLPPGFSFELLLPESAPLALINETWPHKYPGSEWYYQFLIKAKLGYGLYNKQELVAWVFLREIGALGHLYTLEEHRRKGYGELVLKLISNMHLRDKKYTVAYCAGYNTNAAKLYMKLGFKNLVPIDWCDFTQKREK